MNPIPLIAISFVSGTIATSVLIVAAIRPHFHLINQTLDSLTNNLSIIFRR